MTIDTPTSQVPMIPEPPLGVSREIRATLVAGMGEAVDRRSGPGRRIGEETDTHVTQRRNQTLGSRTDVTELGDGLERFLDQLSQQKMFSGDLGRRRPNLFKLLCLLLTLATSIQSTLPQLISGRDPI